MGKYGLFGIQGGKFSDYAVFVTEDGELFATKTGMTVTGQRVPDLSQRYLLFPEGMVSAPPPQPEEECEWWNIGCQEMVRMGDNYTPYIGF